MSSLSRNRLPSNTLQACAAAAEPVNSNVPQVEPVHSPAVRCEEQKQLDMEATANSVRISMASLWSQLEVDTAKVHQNARLLAKGGSADALTYLHEAWRIRDDMLTSFERQQAAFLALDQMLVGLRRLKCNDFVDRDEGSTMCEDIHSGINPEMSLAHQPGPGM